MDIALVDLLVKAAAAANLNYWGSEWLNDCGRNVLRVYVESKDDAGVTLQDCELATKQINALLNVEDIVKGDFDLEISSPGIDRRLFGLEHFQKYIGKHVKLRLKKKQSSFKTISGELLSAGEGELSVNMNGVNYSILIENIDKANLLGG